MPLEEVFGGLTAALADGARERDLRRPDPVLPGDLGADAADAVLRACLPFRDQFIGVGLDSTEAGYPPSLFTEVYKLAAAEGLRLVAHAGEEGGPDYVREALDLLGCGTRRPRGAVHGGSRGWSPGCATSRSR